MTKILLFFFFFCLSCSFIASAGALVGVTSDELQTLLERGALVVDVRTPQEWKANGVIQGSHLLTYFDSSGQYDKDGWLKSLIRMQGGHRRPVVLVCRSGNRSALVGKMMTGEAGFNRVYHLEKGIREWAAQGKNLVSPCPQDPSCAGPGPDGKQAP